VRLAPSAELEWMVDRLTQKKEEPVADTMSDLDLEKLREIKHELQNITVRDIPSVAQRAIEAAIDKAYALGLARLREAEVERVEARDVLNMLMLCGERELDGLRDAPASERLRALIDGLIEQRAKRREAEVARDGRERALVSALNRYGRHFESCPARTEPTATCNCGYDEAMDKLFSSSPAPSQREAT